MPRFFFDITGSHGLHRDEVGDDLDSFHEARELCQTILPDIARDELPDGEQRTVACDVRDAMDRTVYRGKLTFEGTRDP
ncbi:DUF6894 family protein [Lichenibacterium dinghuense]|uniref:DUF6894 family protein n=1 Tax=Lichenibacterium dinghuense TaxID=2895977 RepID=UPI001F1D806B|nr:hypothetical protein [Lichenibacterium sp. 6Y81]